MEISQEPEETPRIMTRSDDTSGALLVDKPEGLTSHDVVARIRWLLGQRRCGHTGTLDPFATGLLILCLGRATRLARFVSSASKTYVARVRFGFATDTYDRTGTPISEVTDRCPSAEELEKSLEGFLGAQEQEPPPFSAKRIQGTRSYRLARGGADVRPSPSRVAILELRLLDLSPPVATLLATVSSGTYIRSLAHDLGKRLGPGAHLEGLRRTRVGPFQVEEASKLELLLEGGSKVKLLSPSEILRDFPSVTLLAEESVRVTHGHVVFADAASLPKGPGGDERLFRVVDESGELLAVASAALALGDSKSARASLRLRPVVVLSRPRERQAQRT